MIYLQQKGISVMIKPVDKHDGREINLMKPWWEPKKNPYLNQASPKILTKFSYLE